MSRWPRPRSKAVPLDELVVLVAEQPGHRGVVADAETRLRLAKAAFPDAEVQLDPHAFTVDSVRDGRFGEDALFVVGADQAALFEKLAGAGGDPAARQACDRNALRLSAIMTSARYGDRVIPFQLASPPISSSEVRRRVAAGETIDDLVPPAVARLIEELGLYR